MEHSLSILFRGAQLQTDFKEIDSKMLKLNLDEDEEGEVRREVSNGNSIHSEAERLKKRGGGGAMKEIEMGSPRRSACS